MQTYRQLKKLLQLTSKQTLALCHQSFYKIKACKTRLKALSVVRMEPQLPDCDGRSQTHDSNLTQENRNDDPSEREAALTQMGEAIRCF